VDWGRILLLKAAASSLSIDFSLESDGSEEEEADEDCAADVEDDEEDEETSESARAADFRRFKKFSNTLFFSFFIINSCNKSVACS
jgi:hypothetical protein